MRHAAVSIGVRLAFAVGALAGIPAMTRWRLLSLLIAMAPLAAAMVVDGKRPKDAGERGRGSDME